MSTRRRRSRRSRRRKRRRGGGSIDGSLGMLSSGNCAPRFYPWVVMP